MKFGKVDEKLRRLERELWKIKNLSLGKVITKEYLTIIENLRMAFEC